jgi:hypothetical protein
MTLYILAYGIMISTCVGGAIWFVIKLDAPG